MKHLKKILVVIMVAFAVKATAQTPDDITKYIATYQQLAIEEMQRTGVPASITLAQGIHETSAGTSDLVIKSNNHFGIKCKTGWSGDKVYHDDDARGECFRSYEKPEESYRDHSNFLKSSSRYGFLFQLDPTDYKGWAYGLKKAGYATNIKYSQILVKLVEDYNLQQYTLIALNKMPVTTEVLASNQLKPESKEVIMPSKAIAPVVEVKAPVYPEGVFTINNTKVQFLKEGTSMLAIANKNGLSLVNLLEFNDMTEGDGDILADDQLVYLQRKRKQGSVEFHTVQPNEFLFDIAQTEGIRYESLLELNHLKDGMEPAAGEKLFLQNAAPARPLLAEEKKSVAQNNSQQLIAANTPSNYITHQVQTKETLYSISKKYEVPVEKMVEWNKLQGNDLKIGQQLIIYKN